MEPKRKPKDTWRKITKNSDHPVQQVRLACKMSQANFGAELGYSESTINGVECREMHVSQEMRSRVYQRFGALIISECRPAMAFAPDEESLELYTEASFERHKRSYKSGWEAFLFEDLFEVLKLMPKAALLKSQKTDDPGLVRAVRLHLQAQTQETIRKFQLREQFRVKIEELKNSPIRKHIKLCHLLCEMTDSRDYAAQLRSLPEFEELRANGITVGGKPATIGEWFESHGFPAE